MDITAATDPPLETPVDLLGLIVFQEDVLNPPPLLDALDQSLGGALRATFADERFLASPGQSTTLQTLGRLPCRRIALVGAGARSSLRLADLRHRTAELVRIANAAGAQTLLVALAGEQPDAPESSSWIEPAAQGLFLGGYRFDRYLSPEKVTPRSLLTAHLHTPNPDAARTLVARGTRVARAIAYARDLVNEPAGTLTPTELANRVSARATEVGLTTRVLGPEDCRAYGMGLFLAVSQGSTQEPRFIHLSWQPAGATSPRNPIPRVVLVGKAVTFDSGGLSLKTNDGMLTMKSDMAGAAAVLAAITLAAEENLPLEVHALAACTENMPSGAAYKLGDVIRSMSGKTVEINNTDAEGRLTLADALTYGLSLRPDILLDFATLTGACIVALGPHTAGVMTNDESARTRWLAAAERAGEDAWPLPLPTRLGEQLKSDVADLRNTGDRWGGALTAGLFLREFVGATPWVHTDLAGPAFSDKEWGCLSKGGTGFGVASIAGYLRALAGA